MLFPDMTAKIVLPRKAFSVILAICDWAREARGTICAVATGRMPLEIPFSIETLGCAALIRTFDISQVGLGMGTEGIRISHVA